MADFIEGPEDHGDSTRMVDHERPDEGFIVYRALRQCVEMALVDSVERVLAPTETMAIERELIASSGDAWKSMTNSGAFKNSSTPVTRMWGQVGGEENSEENKPSFLCNFFRWITEKPKDRSSCGNRHLRSLCCG